MKLPKTPAIIVSVLLLVVAVVLFSRNAAERRVTLPREAYVCGRPSCGHAWTEELTNEPVCPECGSEGAKEARYTCGKCSKTFTAWHTRRVGIGRFEILYPGAKEWTRDTPSHLKCPNCGVMDVLGEGNFRPAAYVARGGDK